MKINLKIFIAICLVSIVLISAFFIFQYRTKTITSFFDNDLNKINKIDITNGSNGNIVTVEDKKMISNISNYLSNLKLKKVLNNNPSTGWNFRLSIYENSKEFFNITFIGEELCLINGTKYKIEKPINLTVETLYNEAIKFKK